MNNKVILAILGLVALYMVISAVVALFHFNPIGFVIDLVLAALAGYSAWNIFKKS
jgi:hypothetical protein